MSRHFSNIGGRYSLNYRIWGALFAIALIVYTILKKMNISDRGNEFYKYLLTSGFDQVTAKFATAQAAHETAGFSSILYTRYNNPFGMKIAVNRTSTQIGEYNGYATYSSVREGVKDFWFWYISKISAFRGLSLRSWVEWLKNKSYFEDTLENYLTGCTNYYKIIFNE